MSIHISPSDVLNFNARLFRSVIKTSTPTILIVLETLSANPAGLLYWSMVHPTLIVPLFYLSGLTTSPNLVHPKSRPTPLFRRFPSLFQILSSPPSRNMTISSTHLFFQKRLLPPSTASSEAVPLVLTHSHPSISSMLALFSNPGSARYLMPSLILRLSPLSSKRVP